MKKIVIALVAGIVGLSSVQVKAEDAVTYSLDTAVAFNSAYVFRGVTLYDSASIQPEATATADLGELGAFTGNVWNHDSAGGNDTSSEKFTEVDFTLGYSIPIDIVTLGGGYIWYRYQNNNPNFADSQEYYLSASVDTILSPSLTYYRDIDAFDSNYYDLTFSQKIEEVCGMGEGFNLTPYVTFGFASDAEGVYAQGGLVTTTVGLSSELKLGDISVTPNVNYAFESDELAQNQFWLGFELGYSWL